MDNSTLKQRISQFIARHLTFKISPHNINKSVIKKTKPIKFVEGSIKINDPILLFLRKELYLKQTLEIKSSRGFKIICTNHILYVEAKGKFSLIYFIDGTSIVTYHLLKWYTTYLIEPLFFRCHNSYIINCCFVESYTHNEINMKISKKIPLARNKISFFKENLEFLLGKVL